MDSNCEKLRNTCVNALQFFESLNDYRYSEIESKLKYCIGSFDYDRNPVGLYHFGEKASDLLKEYVKEIANEKVNQIIVDFEDCLDC